MQNFCQLPNYVTITGPDLKIFWAIGQAIRQMHLMLVNLLLSARSCRRVDCSFNAKLNKINGKFFY